jgi:hypothetical protein
MFALHVYYLITTYESLVSTGACTRRLPGTAGLPATVKFLPELLLLLLLPELLLLLLLLLPVLLLLLLLLLPELLQSATVQYSCLPLP